MYMTSRNSKDNMVHSTGCRYAGRILPHNKVYYDSAETAYTKGKCACRYCAAVMQYVYEEMDRLRELCAANCYSIIFDAATGTLDVITFEYTPEGYPRGLCVFLIMRFRLIPLRLR